MLNHPCVVGIIDSGLINDNPFYVMEFVEGRLLSDLLKGSGRLPVARVLKLAAQICEAIDHAHYFGVIHRNLKPENLMIVAQPDGTELVRILDFGLAKSFFQGEKDQQKLTAPNEVIGSPEYMSPEQCMSKDVDWRSDIYSTGCLLFAMLTGKPPIVGINVLDTIMKQAREKPPTIGQAAPDANVPEPVQKVIMRALEKDPNARQQTMIQLKEELQSAGDSVSNIDGQLESLKQAANAGDRDAQFALGSYLERSNTTQNVGEIAEWFQKSADQGHPDAQFRMGQAYEMGLGVKRSAERAMHYYRLCAEQGRDDARLRAIQVGAFEGDVDSQVSLAMCFKTGNMVPQNFAEVEKWLGKAAEKRFAIASQERLQPVLEFAFTLANRDHPEGLYWLGILYKDGKGVQADDKTAAKWLLKALDKGHPKAAEELKGIPGHIVEEARRGRPRWDQRVTATPYALSPESKLLIEAVQKLKKADTLKNRYDLYESIRESRVVVVFEDEAATRMAAVLDADGRGGAAVFTEFAAMTRWQQAMNKNFPWAEKAAKDIFLQLKPYPDSSIVLDPTEQPGITVRQWEMEALASMTYPVVRGDYLTELELEPGMISFSRVPTRPSEAFTKAAQAAVSAKSWVRNAYFIEAVFEPVRRPPEMTIIVQTSSSAIAQTELKPMADELRDALQNKLGARCSRVLFVPDGAPVIAPLRRASICLYQK
jgi:TPR repeat protein